jgi:hypothetical protein
MSLALCKEDAGLTPNAIKPVLERKFPYCSYPKDFFKVTTAPGNAAIFSSAFEVVCSHGACVVEFIMEPNPKMEWQASSPPTDPFASSEVWLMFCVFQR